MSTRLAAPPSASTGWDASGPSDTGRRAPPPRAAPGVTQADVALAMVSVAGLVGLVRIFSGGAFLAPVVTTVVAAHALAWGLRRLGVGPVLALVVSGVGMVLVIGWLVEPGTLTVGLPLGPTWQAVSADLGAASARFGQVRAPTEATRGFVLACAGGGWIAAVLADSFAFRARARFEALVPSFVWFLFGAVLGAERYRLATTAFWLAAVLWFVVAADASRRSAPAWFGGRSGDGDRALVRSGVATAGAAVLVALLVGPQLPGAHDLGIVGWRNGAQKGSGSRVTVSPLVDIRTRLVNQSGAELFSVGSDVGAYWRLTSLERFDGTIWSSLGSYAPARGKLPTGVATRSTERSVVQQFDITALSAVWLPAAFQPRRLDGAKGVRYDPDSSSLLTDAETADRLRYTVESALPQLDADQLQTAAVSLSAGDTQRYLELPPGFPDRVRGLAADLVRLTPAACQALGGCSAAETSSRQLSPFHQARVLQDWFRANFTYNLNVPAGHDESAIERFLFTTHQGYCEQFAGTFAAMARSLGLPSRVAVGFTTGSRGPDGRWHVTDREAHAWPEVYLAPFGWVAFEPTPGRDNPAATGYSGIQAASGAGDQTGAATTTTPTTAAGPNNSPAITEATTPDTTAPRSGGSGASLPLSPPLLVAVLVVLAWVLGVPLARRAGRARRRSRATTPTSRVLLAWDEAEADLALVGVGRRPSETPDEYAGRAGGARPPVAPALAELAGHISTAAYSPTGADEPAAARAELAAAAVQAQIRLSASPLTRALRALDPRTLLERRRPRA